MTLNLKIKNVGKLVDANLSIGQFTVLAGPNDTGKSTTCKLLYSIFDAINGDAFKVGETLSANFRHSEIFLVAGAPEHPSKVVLDGIGKIQFSNEGITLCVDRAVMENRKRYSGVIYLESPVCWKYKDVLIKPRTDLMYSPISAMKYKGDPAFRGLYEKLIGKDVLDGEIALSESGDFWFLQNGRGFPLSVTGTGVVSLAILALLIRLGKVEKDTFLIIEEPEAYLHPAWQVVMAETLFGLAKGGVNVVISTYSADILKWLEVRIKKNPEDESLVALNKFPLGWPESEDWDFKDKIASIKQELTKPFGDLYMAGL